MGGGERRRSRTRWNFHKYLIGRDGYLKAGFSSAVELPIHLLSPRSKGNWPGRESIRKPPSPRLSHF
jgi:hypothetical protein